MKAIGNTKREESLVFIKIDVLFESNKSYLFSDWGNHELQYYTAGRTKNVRVENGNLVIEAHPEQYGGKQFTSGRINSIKSWTYGIFEFRARLPKGKHLWPAIWLIPKEDKYGGWYEKRTC